MSGYLPVPVSFAAEIAERLDKDQVVILSYNRGHNLVHTTTYGRSAFDKCSAADLGDVVSQAAGCDLKKKRIYEDFRLEAAKLKEENYRLRARIAELEGES